MRLIHTIRATRGAATVLVFTLFCVAGFSLLWVKAGGSVPVVSDPDDYRVVFLTEDSKNLRNTGDVRIAGVAVGRVESRELVGDKVRVEVSLDESAAPLHDGATVRIGVKSLVGSSYVDVVDGDGEELASGTELAAKQVIPAVDVDELLETLDAPTRKALQGLTRGIGEGTRGTGTEVDGLMTGVGRIGREGYTVVDALAAQGEDLTAVSAEAKQLLDALDTGQGQIATLVDAAQSLTGATADKRVALQSLIRRLPGLLRHVEGGAVSLEELSGPLSPVATSLRQAGPDLNAALLTLPAVTRDLDGLLPALDGTLTRAPSTLEKVPAFSESARGLIPDTETLLRDVNPMLAYLEPYGLDLGALFANFGGSFDTLAEDGIRPIRLTATAQGLGTVRGIPIELPNTGLWWNNAYPGPGTVDSPAPFRGDYPQVERKP